MLAGVSKNRQIFTHSGKAGETAGGIIFQNGPEQNMPFDLPCVRCRKILPVGTIDVDGLWRKISRQRQDRNKMQTCRVSIGQTNADADLCAMDVGNLMADVLEDLEEQNRSVVIDRESSLLF